MIFYIVEITHSGNVTIRPSRHITFSNAKYELVRAENYNGSLISDGRLLITIFCDPGLIYENRNTSSVLKTIAGLQDKIKSGEISFDIKKSLNVKLKNEIGEFLSF